MKITSLKEKTDQLKRFEKREWRIANIEHFGYNAYANPKKFLFIAEDHGRIAGFADGAVVAGVCYLSTLLISSKSRRTGIGKKLILKVEAFAKKHHAHKIFLHTGKIWDSFKFYKAMGYEEEDISKDHYGHQEFVQFVKFL